MFRCALLLLTSLAGERAEAPASAHPSVLLLSVDTLRADFLGCYGNTWELTPNIDRLAGESLLFEDAVCEIPLTGPSFAAMLTGRYPRMVGATRNGLRVNDTVPLVTERFREAGYHTFAVLSNWTLRAHLCGLDRGFVEYEDRLTQRRWGIFNRERDADQVTLIARRLLEERPIHQPFFAWIHYSDPHAPYRFRREFAPRTAVGWRGKSREERVRLKYASEVRFTDHHIGKLLEAVPPETRIVFVADHGESLYEHDYLGHGRYLYHPSMQVPLLVRAPGVLPGRTRVPAQTMDIGPTLLGIAGLPRIQGMLGMDLLRDAVPADRPRFMETFGGAVPNFPGARALLQTETPSKQAVIVAGKKLIVSRNRPRALFFLSEDPGELHNRAALHSELADALQELLTQWDAAHPFGALQPAPLDDEDMAVLRSLGYLD